MEECGLRHIATKPCKTRSSLLLVPHTPFIHPPCDVGKRNVQKTDIERTVSQVEKSYGYNMFMEPGSCATYQIAERYLQSFEMDEPV